MNLAPIALTVFSLLVAMPAWADPSLTITPVSGINSSLTLHGEGSTATEIEKVATVDVSTAAPLGYTLTLSSGSLLNTSGGPDIAYQMTAVTAGSNQPQSGDFTVSSGNSFAQCSATSLSLDIYVKYLPATLQKPGNYESTITVEATDNSNAC
jgi:hypothetical protein